MELVNAYYNQIEYVSDTPPGNDDWKQPNRFIKEGGDCEDYAIAKYHALKKYHTVAILTGYIWTRETGHGYHAVLLVDGKYVLDNGFNQILTLEEYIKHYYFNIIEITDDKRKPLKLFPSYKPK